VLCNFGPPGPARAVLQLEDGSVDEGELVEDEIHLATGHCVNVCLLHLDLCLSQEVAEIFVVSLGVADDNEVAVRQYTSLARREDWEVAFGRHFVVNEDESFGRCIDQFDKKTSLSILN
jgi:hypothetical protein